MQRPRPSRTAGLALLLLLGIRLSVSSQDLDEDYDEFRAAGSGSIKDAFGALSGSTVVEANDVDSLLEALAQVGSGAV